MALSVFYRALKARITELTQQSKLVLGQGIMQTDADDRALIIPTSTTTVMTFLPLEDSCIFRMTLGATQVITATTYTKIDFDTLSFDYSGCVDIANSQFTAPVAGIYEFACGVYSTEPTTQVREVSLYNGGSQSLLFSRIFNQWATCNGGHSGPLLLAAGDAIDIRCYLGVNQTLPVSIFTFFSGRRIK